MLSVLNRLVELVDGLLFEVVATAIFLGVVAIIAAVITISMHSTVVRGAIEFASRLMPMTEFRVVAYGSRKSYPRSNAINKAGTWSRSRSRSRSVRSSSSSLSASA